MYKLEFLPIAKNDIDDIIYYISNNLKNVTASRKLRDLFMDSIDKISKFPYVCPIYQQVKFLKNEYRKVRPFHANLSCRLTFRCRRITKAQ